MWHVPAQENSPTCKKYSPTLGERTRRGVDFIQPQPSVACSPEKPYFPTCNIHSEMILFSQCNRTALFLDKKIAFLQAKNCLRQFLAVI
jgi:hypothetical protein